MKKQLAVPATPAVVTPTLATLLARPTVKGMPFAEIVGLGKFSITRMGVGGTCPCLSVNHLGFTRHFDISTKSLKGSQRKSIAKELYQGLIEAIREQGAETVVSTLVK